MMIASAIFSGCLSKKPGDGGELPGWWNGVRRGKSGSPLLRRLNNGHKLRPVRAIQSVFAENVTPAIPRIDKHD